MNWRAVQGASKSMTFTLTAQGAARLRRFIFQEGMTNE